MVESIQNVVDLLEQIENDFSVPKNIRTRMRNAVDILGKEDGRLLAVKADKALEELEAVSDDSNLPTYTRTQIWHIISLLESHK